MKTKFVFNIAINIFLLTVYAIFFGKDSIRKYMDRSIIIVTQEVRLSSIIPPGKIVSKMIYMYLSMAKLNSAF